MGKLKGWLNDLFQVIGNTNVVRTVFNQDGELYHAGTKLTATAAEINALAGLASGSYIVGQKFQISFPNIAAADVGKAFFVALAPCKVIEAQEVHGTVCDAADTMTIEKCATGEDAGAGDVVLTEAFTLNSTANTPVVKTAVTTAAGTLSRGDSLMLKFASGDGTSYAEGCVTVALQYV